MLTEDFEQAQYLSSQVEQARQRAVLAASDAGSSRDGAHAAEQVAREHAKDAERVVQGAEKARDEAQAAADRAEAPTDSMVAELAGNPLSMTRAAVDQATGDMITTGGSTTQAAGDARWVTQTGADILVAAEIERTGSETQVSGDNRWVTNEGADNTISALFSTPGSGVQAVTDARYAKREYAGYVNVQDFGAIGNGTDDALPGIQAAIDYAAGKPLRVYIPAGTWKTIGPIRSPQGGLHLILDEGATIARYANNAMFVNGVQKSTVPGGSNIIIEGGTWDCRGLDVGTDGSVFALGWASNITLRNLTAKNVNLSHIVELAGCESVLFENFKFGGFSSALVKEAFQIERLLSGGFPYFNVNSGLACRNVALRGITQIDPDPGYSRWPTAVGNHENQPVQSADHITMTDCDFGICTNAVFMLDNYTNVLMERVSGSGTVPSVIRSDGTKVNNVTIRDSSIQNATTTGDGILIREAIGVNLENVKTSGRYAVWIAGSDDITIRGGEAFATQYDAIIMSSIAGITRPSKNITLDGVAVKGNHGLAVNGAAGAVTKVNVIGVWSPQTLGGQGVAISGDVTDVQVSGCRFRLVAAAYVVRITSSTMSRVLAFGNFYSAAVTNFTNVPGQVTASANAAVL